MLIIKKPVNADYYALTEKSETNLKVAKIKVNDSALKTNPWTNKIKDLNREKIVGCFYEKELLLSKL